MVFIEHIIQYFHVLKLIELSVHLVFDAVGLRVNLVMIIILTHDYQELKVKNILQYCCRGYHFQ